MTQNVFSDIDPATKTGTQLALDLNNFKASLLSSHKGSSAPSYIVAGQFWINDSADPLWTYAMYDGTTSNAVLEADITNNNFKIKNVKNGAARTDGANIGQIQDNSFSYVGSVSGTNTVTGGMTPAITAYGTGEFFVLKMQNANTGAVTVNIDSVGAKALQFNQQALVGGEYAASDVLIAAYNGTALQILNTPRKPALTGIRFIDTGELTIASGVITVTGTNHTVDTQSDASTDDLDTINGGAAGMIIVLTPEHTDRTVVLKSGTGNILTADGNDVTLSSTSMSATLIYLSDLSAWVVIAAPEGDAAIARAKLDVYSTSESDALQSASDVIHVQHTTTSGTNGGTASTGAWTKRTLNTVVTNGISGASVASSVITLPAGTYDFFGVQILRNTSYVGVRLYDTTNTTVLGPNNGTVTSLSTGDSIPIPVNGRFTLAGTANVEFQYYCTGSSGAGDTGLAWSVTTNVFADIIIRKVG